MHLPNALVLARAQFAFTVMAHIIFPALSIGLASYLAVLEGMWLRTRESAYLDLFNYWLKPFSLVFGMGVVSGLVMSYQFGTNWSVFADKAGPVIGPLMGYEVLSAFFLEAGFLGVMLFGRQKVGETLHFLATCIVAFGTLLSAFWILAVNSWMQTPAGFRLEPGTGRMLPSDWAAIIFNPSFPVRLPHMVLASYLSVAFVVGATGAWHLLRDRANPRARTMFSMAMWMAALAAPAQVAMGDLHGLNTLRYQPAKVAAMEGHYEAHNGAPLVLFGIPNDTEARMDDEIAIPHLSALILTHSWNGHTQGLKDFPPQDRPPAEIVFWSFRLMVGLGFIMAGLGLAGLWLRFRGGGVDSRSWLLRAMVAMGPSGLVALLAGWVTTEVGRQPFTVFGVLRTAESVSPVGAPGLAVSLTAFVTVYALVFGAGIVMLLRLLARPPAPGELQPPKLPSHAAGIMPAPAMAAE